jgi:hypothetical protein
MLLKTVELSCYCNYCIKSCVRQCHYILLIIEHNGDVSPENGLGEVRVDKTIFLNLLAPEF